ncbi:RpiB/LacA/LacB family sugar-phosphate isomerase [Peptoanaerobacter stomatis]|uniref:RpiB/LacA/LacB family sugar-phosphate isomerase n=1 Tax=Peptoanaerobacter stomatis TaxID=796937 RepID=V9HTS9_9FIRM|nr:ribose 5-phosphate isomerase B [Peptoanaerobacter stomatis]EHL14848.1 RpiB/LacA/LacB family sugar-phosphate isomerase [Peptoanaerobacter stomatis]
MKIGFGCDHGGFELKKQVLKYLQDKGYECIDYGIYENQSVDYPDYAKIVAKAVLNKEVDKGILFCGTGIGISIAANKIKGIRCANLSDTYSASKCVEHNNCNMISLGGRTVGVEIAFEIVDRFLSAKFEGDRHERRVNKLMSFENEI